MAVCGPGRHPAGPFAWWPGVATLVFAAAGPGAVAAWQHRLPRRRHRRRRWPWLPRVVFEVTACAAAIGGITVFRMQTGATNLYASAAPVLVAVPAVIVALRLYQLVLRGLARASAQRRGVIGFLGLTRAAHAPVALALAAITLVLALTMAAFTGIVRVAVVRGEIAASWQATGADVVVAAPISSPSAPRPCRRSPRCRGTACGVGPHRPLDQRWRARGGGHHRRPGQLRGPGRLDGGVPPVRSALLTKPAVRARSRCSRPPSGRRSWRARRQQLLRSGRPSGAARPGLRRTSVHPGAAGRRSVIVLPMSAIRGVSEPPPVNLLL